MLPVTLGLGLINFNAVVDTLFASRLIDGELAPTAIDKAFRLYMLPQGVFSVAVTTVLFPTLSRLAARGDREGFRATVGLGLRQIAFLLVPASALFAVLAEPIVRIVFQRGEFEPSQTPAVAGALAAFSLGLTFNGTMLMLNRAFFSLQLPWLPTAVAGGNLLVNALLDLALYPLGIWGIPLATSGVNLAGTAALMVLLRRQLGSLDVPQILAGFARILAAAATSVAVAYPLWSVLDDALGRGLGGQAISLGAAFAAAAAVYLVSCRLLGVRELDALLSLRRRRQGG